MNSDEISLKLVEKEQAILSASEALNEVQIELYRLKKTMIGMREDTIIMTENERQAKYNLAKLKIELSILTREFWLKKNG